MKKTIALVMMFCFIFLFAADAFAAKPAIKKQPETATTTKSGSVSFSVTVSGDVTSYSWFFVNPETGKKISGKKLPKNKTVKGVKVSGPNRPKITLTHVPESMHGWLVYCVVTGGSGYKVDSEYATLLVYGMDEPEAAPVTGMEITAQPKAAGISSKGKLTFTVEYSGLAEKITWAFINPKGNQKVIGKNILKKFKDMKVSGINKAKLTLSNAPEDMVGWKVYAHLKGKGIEIDTDAVAVLSAAEVAAAKKAAKKKETKEEAKTETKSETPAVDAAEAEDTAEAEKIITVSCSDSVIRKLDNAGRPVGEPSSELTFINVGSFIVSSEKPIKSWTINGLVNEPSAPVREFLITNVLDSLSLILTFE